MNKLLITAVMIAATLSASAFAGKLDVYVKGLNGSDYIRTTFTTPSTGRGKLWQIPALKGQVVEYKTLGDIGKVSNGNQLMVIP